VRMSSDLPDPDGPRKAARSPALSFKAKSDQIFRPSIERVRFRASNIPYGCQVSV